MSLKALQELRVSVQIIDRNKVNFEKRGLGSWTKRDFKKKPSGKR